MKSKSNIQTLEKVQTVSTQTRKLFEEPNKFAQKSETVSRKFNRPYYASWLPLLWYHYPISQTVSVESETIFKKPQMNADERRLIDFDFQQLSDIYLRKKVINSPQRTQRAQSTGIFKIFFEKTQTLPRRTTMTRIGRIFTDIFNPRASAQSAFHPKNPNNHVSAFIRVHLRLAESIITPQQKAQSMAAVIFASFALFAVRFINSLNELSSIAQPSAFIDLSPRLIYRTGQVEGR